MEKIFEGYRTSQLLIAECKSRNSQNKSGSHFDPVLVDIFPNIKDVFAMIAKGVGT